MSVRFEDTVRKPRLLLGNESLVERIAHYELFNFVFRERDRVDDTLLHRRRLLVEAG